MPGMRVRGRVVHDGIPKVIRRLDTLQGPVARDIGTQFQREVRGRTPVGREVYTDDEGTHPGVLRSGNTVEHPRPGRMLAYNPVSYAGFVNDGTHKTDGTHFWTQSVHDLGTYAPAKLANRLRTVAVG
jgi:hypothetical protein